MRQKLADRVCPVCRKSYTPGKVNQVVCSRATKCFTRYCYLRNKGRLDLLDASIHGVRTWHEHANKFITKHPTARRDFHELETVLS